MFKDLEANTTEFSSNMDKNSSLKEKYPKLECCLAVQYDNSFQLNQIHVSTLINFVNTLYESEIESQRKEVNPYEEVKEDTYLGRNRRDANKLIPRNKKNSTK